MAEAKITTDEQRAYCVHRWIRGDTQKAIAAEFGFNTPTAVCLQISWFIDNFLADSEDYRETRCVEGRKALGAKALAAWARAA